VPPNAKIKKLPIRFWENSQQEKMHSLFNRYLNGVLATPSLVALISLLTATAIPAQPSSVASKFLLHPDLGGQGVRPATIICVDDNPASLSGVKAGQLLSTVSQEVWQGEGRSFRLLSSGARRTAGGNNLRSVAHCVQICVKEVER
jgi:hypothetical protein